MHQTPRIGRAPSQRRGPSDRGSTTIQMVILMPVMFSVMFLGLQGALYYYAATTAGAAAQDGARAAAAHGPGHDLAAGTAAALSALDQSHGSLQSYTVTGQNATGGPTITVSGQSLSVVPGLSFTVTRSATLPWERPS